MQAYLWPEGKKPRKKIVEEIIKDTERGINKLGLEGDERQYDPKWEVGRG